MPEPGSTSPIVSAATRVSQLPHSTEKKTPMLPQITKKIPLAVDQFAVVINHKTNTVNNKLPIKYEQMISRALDGGGSLSKILRNASPNAIISATGIVHPSLCMPVGLLVIE